MFSIGDDQLGVDLVLTFPEMNMGIHATESKDDKFEDTVPQMCVCNTGDMYTNELDIDLFILN